MRLEAEQLDALREALEAIHGAQGREIPNGALARLSAALPAGIGMTIDYDAAAALGHPLVVLRPSSAPDETFDSLSPRELEVAGLVASGLRNADIAVALAISIATVKDHVHRILHKTGLDSRAMVAACWARRER